MIYGIGVDIVKVERVREIVEKWGERFLHRVFTDQEIRYCYGKKSPYLSLSVRFAAKEACVKAVGSKLPVSLKDIEVVNDIFGKPAIKTYGNVDIFFREHFLQEAHLSLSHEKDYGIACVVIESDNP
ncbi:MAG TPA: holo-[acyl-carrier-protein] synthase [Nitrospiraceae bacterium]|jgi:holo-[acyl-carrier protein] synthase|nr:holo-[acyl-carrier-protein] synthase [Nitrospiraceae bacterium]